DPAIVGGIAELAGRPVVIVAQQKGASTEENIQRNFGMPYPEGYRKAIRLYRLAEKFHLPLVTLVDTPGAYPGPEDVYPVGTVALIMRMLKLPDGRIRVLVQGIGRARILSF